MLRTGENEQGLKKVTDLTRWIALAILFIHFYYYCYSAFELWGFIAPIGDQFLARIADTGLLKSFNYSKTLALFCLLLSLMGVKGRKDEKSSYSAGIAYLVAGLIAYYCSGFLYWWPPLAPATLALCYMSISIIGLLLVITGGSTISRAIKQRLRQQVFAEEGFPQEERLLTEEYSLNLPAVYTYKGQQRRSWINFLNARRSVLVLGSPGSGKSFYVIENLIRQLVAKKQVLFVFDQKFPELSTLTYNHYQKHQREYPANTEFRTVNFTNPELSHQCNPIHQSTLPNLTSAIDSAKSLLLSMNRTWATRQGEFFPESAINVFAAVIGFLRRYEDGAYCSLPHCIELIHQPYDKLFTVLQTEPEIKTLINPFAQAFADDELETLNSQMATVKIALGRIASPEIYWVLSGDDFTLAINDPKRPIIFCLGNNPQYQEALAPIISLYIDRLNKMINQPGKYPCAQVLDEFASARAISVLSTIQTGRSNNITTILGLQDLSQLKMIYCKDEADTIFNITGNIISGQVSGETARLLSEKFAKTFQDRESISINSGDTSISRSKQLDQSVPPSTIASLSSGEFVGVVSDNPNQPIKYKAFHCRVINDYKAIEREKQKYKPLPVVNKANKEVMYNQFLAIKQQTQDIVDAVLEQVLNNPDHMHLSSKS
ncbi:YWFCY domain-containing protein [Paraflavitalea pollutisoli]|uniref:YWFCY domain-containing protein n=1 Tax=Paraflavitalea pollutisoli TaxID=3034143 RepID=UPI0023EB8C0D|nr:YWFCY domain-containing protein [Paraflavitalea sp. H1-2-19X]